MSTAANAITAGTRDVPDPAPVRPIRLNRALLSLLGAGVLFAGAESARGETASAAWIALAAAAITLLAAVAPDIPKNLQARLFAAVAIAAALAGVAGRWSNDAWSLQTHRPPASLALLGIAALLMTAGVVASRSRTGLSTAEIAAWAGEISLPGLLFLYAILVPVTNRLPAPVPLLTWLCIGALVLGSAVAFVARGPRASNHRFVLFPVALPLVWTVGAAILTGAWAATSTPWRSAGLVVLSIGLAAAALTYRSRDAGRDPLLMQPRIEPAVVLTVVPPLPVAMAIYTVYAARRLALEPLPLIAAGLLTAGAFAVRAGAGLAAKERDWREALAQQSELVRQANVDALTELPNRAALEQRLAEEFERARRYRQPLTVCFADIDHFKQINDTYGHAKGDEVLREVAAAMRLTARSIDFVARAGGEEFVVIAPGTWTEDGVTLGERLRTAVAGWTSAAAPRIPAVTLSVGVAGYPEHANQASELLAEADTALYQAKRSGRDRVCLAGDDA